MTQEPGAIVRYRIDPRVAWQEVEGEIFAVGAEGHLHNLRQPSAVALWHWLQGDGATLDELVGWALDEFEGDEPTVRRDVEAFIEEAAGRGLVEVVEAAESGGE